MNILVAVLVGKLHLATHGSREAVLLDTSDAQKRGARSMKNAIRNIVGRKGTLQSVT